MNQNIRQYGKYFTEQAFWATLRRRAAQAGRRLVETALVLYHCLRDPETPSQVRVVILGALGYLILPADLVPDLIPGVGFADDLATLAAAFSMVMAYIKPEHQWRARQQVQAWFPVEDHG